MTHSSRDAFEALERGEYDSVLSESPRRPNWQVPTVDEPTEEELIEYVFDSVCEATDGCTAEPDGICPHGHPSWLLRLGMV